MIWFIIGFLIGVFVGFFLAAIGVYVRDRENKRREDDDLRSRKE